MKIKPVCISQKRLNRKLHIRLVFADDEWKPLQSFVAQIVHLLCITCRLLQNNFNNRPARFLHLVKSRSISGLLIMCDPADNLFFHHSHLSSKKEAPLSFASSSSLLSITYQLPDLDFLAFC